MCLRVSYKKKYEIFFCINEVGTASVLSGTRTKMSGIPNTDHNNYQETENLIKWNELRKFECKRKTLHKKSKQIICSCGLFYYCWNWKGGSLCLISSK